MEAVMKKRYIIIGIIIVLAVVLSIWLLTRPKELGNIRQAYSKPETSTSNISFSGEAGDRIKFSFASNIKNGDLDIIVYDSKGNDAYKLDRAKESLVLLWFFHEAEIFGNHSRFSERQKLLPPGGNGSCGI